jgi:mxaJ protein
VIALLLSLASLHCFAAEPRVLRVAADPNNLPFSNERGEGFENRIVALIAHELGATVEYTWHAQRRGFVRETMKDGPCDLVAGVPVGFERTLTTVPYYRSGYVLVALKNRRLKVRSLDDPRLREWRVGVQMIGDDFNNSPPAHALTRRGLVENIRGFTVYGDYRERAPPARIVDAVAKGEIDVAAVWGPLAGYEAKQREGTAQALEIVPLRERDAVTGLPMAFDIALGVRRNAVSLRNDINAVLARKRVEIDAILADYGVPRLDRGEGGQ